MSINNGELGIGLGKVSTFKYIVSKGRVAKSGLQTSLVHTDAIRYLRGMSDVTPQKRVLPARERRESAAKRRVAESSPARTSASTPLVAPKKGSANLSSEPRQKRKYVKRVSLVETSPATPRSSPSVDESLPTRVAASQPLPTSRQKQPAHLSLKEFQSIAESATLAASLHRSRMKWLCDGIFQKYWTKPVKRKGVIDVPPNNPDPKSMQKLGNATITIEPHTFDAVFYTVRDPLAPASYYRHPNQHTAKAAFPPPPQYGIYCPPASAPRPPASTPQAVARPASASAVGIKQEEGTKPTAAATHSATPPTAPPASREGPPAPAASPPKGNSDPVIQMLAARAATNTRLKELMKVVATSKASPEQLKEFQSHIDEFNAVIRRQEAERAGREREHQSPPQPAPTSAALPQLDGSADTRPEPKPSTTPVHASSPPAAHPATYNSTASLPRPPPGSSGLSPSPFPAGARGPIPPYMTYAPPPRPEAIIKHIVMELTSAPSSTQPACPDRWLFPEYAVLDMRYGGLEMICSFFVERTGSQILSATAGDSGESATWQAKWKADQEYFQPVTMTVKATNHRTIETIARAAKSLPTVQSYMKQVMEKKTRAPPACLVHQLPRDKGHAAADAVPPEFVDSGVEMGSDAEDDELRDFYGH